MFFIRAMGCDYHHDSNFLIERECGYDCYLALFIKSRSLLKDGDNIISCEPGTFILFNINSPHYYSANKEEYIEDWIQFECDESYISRLSLPLDKPVFLGARSCMDSYFSLIRDVYFRCINDNEIIDHLMQAMLAEVSAAVKRKEKDIPHFKELINLRREIHSDPSKDWSVEKMAYKLHISMPYMQELYKKAFNISCMTDVIECRISYAKSLLSSSELSTKEIAVRCGYNSIVHFSRQFKKITGYSPVEYRKSKPQGNNWQSS